MAGPPDATRRLALGRLVALRGNATRRVFGRPADETKRTTTNDDNERLRPPPQTSASHLPSMAIHGHPRAFSHHSLANAIARCLGHAPPRGVIHCAECLCATKSRATRAFVDGLVPRGARAFSRTSRGYAGEAEILLGNTREHPHFAPAFVIR